MRQLDTGFASEVDTVDEQEWYRILQGFNDANIHQTYAAAVVAGSRHNISHLILRKNGEIVAAAQARITRIPLLNVGVATIQAGPLWERAGNEPDLESFRQAIRASRNEYVCKRGLVLRLIPEISDDSPCFSAILGEEGFSLTRDARDMTIIMDLNTPLEELYEGLAKKWKYNLRVANKGNLELIEGTSEDLFGAFLGIYNEMVSRKKFVSFSDINKFRKIQARLPENFKMIIMLARSDEGLCAGLICTAIGKSVTWLFGATSISGLKSCGSYLLQWKLIEKLKEKGFSTYDLGGIDPAGNPGSYRFKRDLGGVNGREVYRLGRFDSHPGLLGYACVNLGDGFKTAQRKLKRLAGGFHFEGAGAKG